MFILVSGTAERVCLISGNAESIMEVLTFIMEKIRDRPDFSKATPTPVQNDSFDNKISQEREKQVSLFQKYESVLVFVHAAFLQII